MTYCMKIIDRESCDILVAGAGVTGCCAALAAARQGARVLLVEKLPFLGGNMTGGLPWLGFHAGLTGEQVVGGIPMEMIKSLQKQGAATDFVWDPIAGSGVGVNGTMLKLSLGRMVQKSGCGIRLHTLVSGVEGHGGQDLSVYCISKQGCAEIRCKVLVDCTDSADAAVLAGAGYASGRARDGKRQVASHAMVFGGIDFGEMLAYFDANPDQIRPFPLAGDTLKRLVAQMHTAPLFILGAFSRIIEEARQAGIPYARKQLIGVAYPPQRELMVVASRVEDVDPNDVRNHTAAELEGLDQTDGILRLMRAYLPGCRNARIVSAGTQLGLRETRHVDGQYTLTAEDLMGGVPFPDSVCKGGYHLDIHSPDHHGLETSQPPVYQIPYRCFLPKKVEGVLVAGRGISATHEAMSSTRVAPISAAQGQAAGTAAALAVASHTPPGAVDVAQLQSLLRKSGALL